MPQRIIPLTAISAGHHPAQVPDTLVEATGSVLDTRGRHLHDLRISVTDRCNFRCTYCMPREVFDKDYPYVAHDALLTFEEITRVARLFVAHGVCKLRLTGGEPLLRRNIESLIEMLAQLRTPAGERVDLTLTTNGSLLARKAQALKDAGLSRLTVSLDGLDDECFRRMNDAEFPVQGVLEGIDAAQRAGFESIKVNMVVQRGVNDDQIVPMAEHFRGTGHIVRFIEYMDVGSSNGWRLDDMLPSAQVLARIDRVHPLEALEGNYAGEVAERWRYRDGAGEIGVISSVTQAFCHSCTRARLSTEGRLYTCLFATGGSELRELLRAGASDLAISNAIAAVWRARSDNYSETRTQAAVTRPKVEMSYIGG